MQVQIGKGIALEVAVDELSPAVMDHVVYIGLRNILMDAHASATVAEHGESYVDVARGMAEKKLAAMLAGEVRTTASREGDPVRAEAIRIATDQIKAAMRKAGVKMQSEKFPDGKTPAEIRAGALRHIEKTPEIMELARKRVEESRASTVGDLSDLIG